MGEVLEGRVQVKTRDLTFIGTDKGVLKAKGAMDIPVGARVRLKVVMPGYPARVKVESWKIDARQPFSKVQGLMAKSLSNLSRLGFIAQEISRSETFSHARPAHGEQISEKSFLTLLRPFEVGTGQEKGLREAVSLSPAFSRVLKGIFSKSAPNTPRACAQGGDMEGEKAHKDGLMARRTGGSVVEKGGIAGEAKHAVKGQSYQVRGGNDNMAVSDNVRKKLLPEAEVQEPEGDIIVGDEESGIRVPKRDSAISGSCQNAASKNVSSQSVSQSSKMQVRPESFQKGASAPAHLEQGVLGEQDPTRVEQGKVSLSNGVLSRGSTHTSQNDFRRATVVVSKEFGEVLSTAVDKGHAEKNASLPGADQGEGLLSEGRGGSGDSEAKRADAQLTDKGYSRPSGKAEGQEKTGRSTQFLEDRGMERGSYDAFSKRQENVHSFFKGFATQLEIAQDIQAHFVQKGLELVVIPFLFHQFQGVGQWIYWQEKDTLSDREGKGTLSHLVFDLNLNNLGKLNIHLLKDRNILSVQIWGEREKIPLVREGMMDLANELKSAGFQIGNLDVSVAGENGAGSPDESVPVIDVQGFHVIT